MHFPWGPGDPMFGQAPVWVLLLLLILFVVGLVMTVMSIVGASLENKKMAHKSGAVMSKRMSEWLNPHNEQHLRAFMLWQLGCPFPEGFEPSEIWRDPLWADKIQKRVEDESVVIPRVVRDFVQNYERVLNIIEECSFPGYEMLLTVTGDSFVLRLSYEEPDVYSSEIETQVSRPWLISPDATTSQVIQTVFKAIMTSFEHRARENFHWRGKPVLMPHLDLEQIWAMLPAGMHQEDVFRENDSVMAGPPPSPAHRPA